MKHELKTYSFTQDDINLITHALRRLNETTMFSGTKEDTTDLLEYIERLKNELQLQS
jgi:hypothetical protein